VAIGLSNFNHRAAFAVPLNLGVSALMQTSFLQLNKDWNAEPNAPSPVVDIRGTDLVLSFYVNAFLCPEFEEDEIAILRFVHCTRYRLGSTNDESKGPPISWPVSSERMNFSLLMRQW
jgi:hypothetical protein